MTSDPRAAPIQDAAPAVATAVALERLTAVLESVETKLDDARAETKVLEVRIMELEKKVELVRGMWMALTIAGALLGVVSILTGIAVGLKRLFWMG